MKIDLQYKVNNSNRLKIIYIWLGLVHLTFSFDYYEFGYNKDPTPKHAYLPSSASASSKCSRFVQSAFCLGILVLVLVDDGMRSW